MASTSSGSWTLWQTVYDAVLDLFDVRFELVEQGELHLDHGRRVAWQLVQRGVDVDPALDAKQVADAGGLQTAAVDGGVNAVRLRWGWRGADGPGLLHLVHHQYQWPVASSVISL